MSYYLYLQSEPESESEFRVGQNVMAKWKTSFFEAKVLEKTDKGMCTSSLADQLVGRTSHKQKEKEKT